MKPKKLIIRTLLCLVFIGFSLFAFLVYNTSQQYKKMKTGPIVSFQNTDTIPFTYSSTGHIVIKAKLPGLAQEKSFILDCGASNMIFKGHCDGINLKNNGFGIGLGAKGNLFLTKIKKLDSLQIGSYKFVDINMKEIDFNIDCSDEICGLIGTGIMRNFDWQIDFEKQQIITSNHKDNFNFGENVITIPLHENKHSSHLSTSIQFRKNKKRHSVLIDLGNNGTLNLKENIILKDSVFFEFKSILGENGNTLGNTNNNVTDEKIYFADSVYFNKCNYSITNFPIETSPKGINILGLGFFEKYKTTISWESKELLLEPYSTSQNFVWNTFGFSLKHDDKLGKTIIGTLLENSPATCANVPLNAEVVSINNYKFTNKASFCSYKTQKKTDYNIELEINENGILRKFNLEKQPIFE